MKTIAYTALHYGTDYLGWAIRSVIDYIDEYYVLYSAIGSHGYRTDKTCPDSRDDLIKIAMQAAGDKLRWYDGEWPYEGAQRDSIYKICPDADVILVLDADEIWQDKLVRWTMEWSNSISYTVPKRCIRFPMVHYWRSFNRAILHDPALPIRLIYPRIPQGEDYFGSWGLINHMGYAQRSEIVQYKLETHGHHNEFRHDCDWFNDKFMSNAQTDCHPVGSDYWNPKQINPLDYLPEFMKYHPYFGQEVIK